MGGPSSLRDVEAAQRSAPRWMLPVVVIATLTIGGWFVIQSLTESNRIEDCQMSGRKNCVPPIDTSKMGR